MLNKRMLLTLIAASLLMLVAQSGYAAEIDIDKSQIGWLATKVTGQHNGSIKLVQGQVVYSGKDITAARFTFDMNSIKVLDIEDPKWNNKLTNHLRSDDFFSVDKYPTSHFELSAATPIKDNEAGEANYHFMGDLTIKGITQVVNFNAYVDLDSTPAKAHGQIIVDRTKYNIRYRSGSFFENLGDKTIHDDFTITFDVVTQ